MGESLYVIYGCTLNTVKHWQNIDEFQQIVDQCNVFPCYKHGIDQQVYEYENDLPVRSNTLYYIVFQLLFESFKSLCSHVLLVYSTFS